MVSRTGFGKIILVKEGCSVQAQRSRRLSSAIGLKVLSVLLSGLADGRKTENDRVKCSVCGAYCQKDACCQNRLDPQTPYAFLDEDLSQLCPFINEGWHRYAEGILKDHNLKSPETAAILLYKLLEPNEGRVKEYNDSVDDDCSI